MHTYSIDKNIRNKFTVSLFIASLILAISLRLLLAIPLDNFHKWLLTTSAGSVIQLVEIIDFLPNVLGTAAIFAFLSNMFEKHAWKWRIIRNAHGIPDLNGRWEGKLRSSYNDEFIDMILDIKQTWNSISFKSTFPSTNSLSYSNVAAICIEDLRGATIYFGFRNESQDINSKMQTYDGYNILTLVSENTISAKYFNNRPNPAQNITGGNIGTFELTRHTNT